MIDLVKTHLTHPWGPPGTLETLGDPWRHAWKLPFWGKGAIACDVSPVAMIWFPQQCVIVKRYDTLWKGPLNCLNRRTRAWELCGITSWGAGCADASQLTYLYSYLYCLIPIYCFFPDLPGVYTRVTNYLPWIKKNLLNTKWKNDQISLELSRSKIINAKPMPINKVKKPIKYIVVFMFKHHRISCQVFPNLDLAITSVSAFT